MTALFLLQDSRSFVGNDMLFWKEGGGYTTDVSKAERFTQERAIRQNKCRSTDLPWPVEYIEAKTRPAVDFQYVNIKLALEGTGITLEKLERKRPEPLQCAHCGRFIKEMGRHYPCTHCEGDLRL